MPKKKPAPKKPAPKKKPPPKKPARRYHTDEQLQALALNLIGNQVYMSDQCSPDMVSLVFMPLLALDKKTHTKMRKDRVAVVYEYMNKAMPRAINGMPCFASMHMLTEADYKLVRELETQLRDVIKLAVPPPKKLKEAVRGKSRRA